MIAYQFHRGVTPTAPAAKPLTMLPASTGHLEPMTAMDVEKLKEKSYDLYISLEAKNPAPIQGLYGSAIQRTLFEMLEKIKKNALFNILGLSRCGKTSILQALVELMRYDMQIQFADHKPATIPLYFSMQQFEFNPEMTARFGISLKRDISSVLKENHITYPEVEKLPAGISQFIGALSGWGLSVALFIDEYDPQEIMAEELLKQILSIREQDEQNELGFRLLISTTPGLRFDKKALDNPSLKAFVYKDLPLAPLEDARAMVSHILRNFLDKEVSPSDAFIEALHRTSGGWPYIIKRLLIAICKSEHLDLLITDKHAAIMNTLFSLLNSHCKELNYTFQSWYGAAHEKTTSILTKIICDFRSKIEDILPDQTFYSEDDKWLIDQLLATGLIGRDGKERYYPKNLLFAYWLSGENLKEIETRYGQHK